MIRLTRVVEILMMTATIITTGRRIKAIAAKQKPGDEYPNEVENPTRTASLETRPTHRQNVRTNRVVVVIPI